MAKKYMLCLIMLCFTIIPAKAEMMDTGTRIHWIQDRLDQAAQPARRWQYGWTTAYGGMAYLYTAQASALDESDEDHDRYDAVVNACSSFLGFAGMLLDPLSTESAAKRLKLLPESTDQERTAKLRQAEESLRSSANRERRGRSWQAHALAGLVNVLAGVAVACDDSREGDGLAMFAGGMLVSEIQIFTTPTRATRAWNAYQTGEMGPMTEAPASPLFFSALPGGIAVHYNF